MSGQKPLAIGPFHSIEALCGLSGKSDGGTSMRLGGAIRGKWRIFDGKDGEGSVVIFGALKGVAPTCVN
jgi:hypothetical protein